MQATRITPRFSHLSAAARLLVMPTLVLTAVACDDSPTAPPRTHDSEGFDVAAPVGYEGQILFTSGLQPAGLYLVDPATKNIAAIPPTTPDDYLTGSWSSDYSRIAFRKGVIGGVWVMNADGTGEYQIAPHHGAGGNVFSADGQYVAFIGQDATDKLQVFKVHLATGQITQLTNLTGVGTRVSWSPDGKKILFDRSYSSNPNLFTIAPDGTGLKQLTRCSSYCKDGHYSPDGKQIALIYNGQVATMMAAGNKMQAHTSAADPWPHWPSWSPAGDRLAYERYAGGQHNIWVLTLANGTIAPVVTGRYDDTGPSWTR